MKKVFLLFLTVGLIVVIEVFQASGQQQMLAMTPMIEQAQQNYSSAMFAVEYPADQQQQVRQWIAQQTRQLQQSASEAGDAQQQPVAVLEQIADGQGQSVYYFGGLTQVLPELFPISGTLSVDFNDPEESGYYTADRTNPSAQMSYLQSAAIQVRPYWQSADQNCTQTTLWLFSKEESDWLDFKIRLCQQFDDLQLTLLQYQSADVSAPMRWRTLWTAGMSVAIGVLALITVIWQIRRDRSLNASLDRESLTVLLGRAVGVEALVSVLLIPALILLTMMLQGVRWNAYTNFIYTELFHLYGWLTLAMAISGVAGWLMLWRRRRRLKTDDEIGTRGEHHD